MQLFSIVSLPLLTFRFLLKSAHLMKYTYQNPFLGSASAKPDRCCLRLLNSFLDAPSRVGLGTLCRSVKVLIETPAFNVLPHSPSIFLLKTKQSSFSM